MQLDKIIYFHVNTLYAKVKMSNLFLSPSCSNISRTIIIIAKRNSSRSNFKAKIWIFRGNSFDVSASFHHFFWKLQRERSFFVFSKHSAPLNSRSIFVMKNCTYFTVFVHSSRMPLSSSCLSLLNCIYTDSLSPLLANLPHATLSLPSSLFIYLYSHLASASIPLETSQLPR